MAFGFAVLLCGLVLMFLGRITEGVATGASTLLLYFIQRIFQQREDHYRAAADHKSQNLEYGNQWLLVIQSIDAIEDPSGRAERQSRLVDVLTQKLRVQRAAGA